MLIIECQRCGFRSTTYLKCVQHFLEIRHQKKSRENFLNWDYNNNLRSLVLYYYSDQQPPPLPSEIVEIFRRLSVKITDFVYWPEASFVFIVQLEDKNDVDRLIDDQRKGNLSINEQGIQIKRKSDVLKNEWMIYSQFQNRQQILVELEDDQSDETLDPVDTSNEQGMRNNENEVIEAVELESIASDPSQSSNNISAAPQNVDDHLDPEQEQSLTNENSDEDTGLVTVKSTMSSKFVEVFGSKADDTDEDDKHRVKANLKRMEQKWIEVYLHFHNELWSACFLMNKHVENRKVESVGFEISFRCTCMESDESKWLREKIDREYMKGKVTEFKELLCNASECKNKSKKVKQQKLDKENLMLEFTCRILILFNGGKNTGAELTISDVNTKYKTVRKNMRKIELIFKKCFKNYEKFKIEEWTSGELERPKPLVNTKAWTSILNAK